MFVCPLAVFSSSLSSPPPSFPTLPHSLHPFASSALIASGHCLPSRLITPPRMQHESGAPTFIASTLSQDIGIAAEDGGRERGGDERRGAVSPSFFFRLQGRRFSKSARGYTPAPRLPQAFRLPPNSQPPSVSHGQMMGRFPLCSARLCPAPPPSPHPPPTLPRSAHPRRLEWQSCQGTVRSH